MTFSRAKINDKGIYLSMNPQQRTVDATLPSGVNISRWQRSGNEASPLHYAAASLEKPMRAGIIRHAGYENRGSSPKKGQTYRDRHGDETSGPKLVSATCKGSSSSTGSHAPDSRRTGAPALLKSRHPA